MWHDFHLLDVPSYPDVVIGHQDILFEPSQGLCRISSFQPSWLQTFSERQEDALDAWSSWLLYVREGALGENKTICDASHFTFSQDSDIC